MNNADYFYQDFTRQKGNELYNSIIKNYYRILKTFDENERNNILKQLEYYIINYSDIYNLNKQTNSSSMPAVHPNHSGDVYGVLTNKDMIDYDNGELYYNSKSGNVNIRFE